MVRITFSVCRHRANVACTAVLMAAVGSNPRSVADSCPAVQPTALQCHISIWQATQCRVLRAQSQLTVLFGT